MLAISASQGITTYLLVFRRGEDLLEELTKFLKEHAIDTGLITGGIATFDVCTIHYITTTDLPSKNEFLTFEGPIEAGSLQGTIIGGVPHIHLTIHNANDGKIYTGHLEPGSRCCYRAEMGLTVFTGVKTVVIKDQDTRLPHTELAEA